MEAEKAGRFGSRSGRTWPMACTGPFDIVGSRLLDCPCLWVRQSASFLLDHSLVFGGGREGGRCFAANAGTGGAARLSFPRHGSVCPDSFTSPGVLGGPGDHRQPRESGWQPHPVAIARDLPRRAAVVA